MRKRFLFNSPPRSGNVFSTYVFSMFIDEHVTKCLKTTKYSDKSQKQAAFFRNPYEALPSTVVKLRVDWGSEFDNHEELKDNIEKCAQEYLDSIREAKANQSNLYLGRSEDMMSDPVGTIKDIALFFGLEIKNNSPITNDEVLKDIENQMSKTEKTRVDKNGQPIVETLMSGHDGHMPRQKIEQRILLDNLIQEMNSEIITECYNEYMSIKPTNAKEGQRWVS